MLLTLLLLFLIALVVVLVVVGFAIVVISAAAVVDRCCCGYSYCHRVFIGVVAVAVFGSCCRCDVKLYGVVGIAAGVVAVDVVQAAVVV